MNEKKEIQVYPKATVYCPESESEQKQDVCASCSLYRGHRVNDNRFYIVCGYKS